MNGSVLKLIDCKKYISSNKLVYTNLNVENSIDLPTEFLNYQEPGWVTRVIC